MPLSSNTIRSMKTEAAKRRAKATKLRDEAASLDKDAVCIEKFITNNGGSLAEEETQ